MAMMAQAHAMEPAGGLGGSLVKSVVFHGALFLVTAGWAWYTRIHIVPFGDENAVGGVTVVATDGIPMPQQSGRVNPVANDTKSQVPDQPKPIVRQEERDDPDAVQLEPGRKKKKKLTPFEERILAQQKKLAEEDLRPEQVNSSTGRTTVSPLFSQSTTGAGGTVGTGNPFGSRFGWYAQLITQRISQKWRTQDVDARISSANICSVLFEIMKDGRARDVKVSQSSGSYEVDRSAERAIVEASPFPPLPDGFERDSARVQMNFQFKR